MTSGPGFPEIPVFLTPYLFHYEVCPKQNILISLLNTTDIYLANGFKELLYEPDRSDSFIAKITGKILIV